MAIKQKQTLAAKLKSTSDQSIKKCFESIEKNHRKMQEQCKNAITKLKLTQKKQKEQIKKSQMQLKKLSAKKTKKPTTSQKSRIKSLNTKLKTFNKNLDKITAEQHTHKQNLAAVNQNLSHYKLAKKNANTKHSTPKKIIKPPKLSKSKSILAEKLTAGMIAPDFKCLSDTNEPISLHGLKGKNIVLYFYPKDSTPGCTKQACDFSKHKAKFHKNNTAIIGISRDSVSSHNKFREKYKINFPLLPDTDENVCKTYDVIKNKNMYGRQVRGIERSTFLINSNGIIQKIWRKVKVPGHVEEVLENL